MGLKCGIVGLPNVGKSTLFNALTKAGIAAENYPYPVTNQGTLGKVVCQAIYFVPVSAVNRRNCC